MKLHLRPNPEITVDGAPLRVRDPVTGAFIPDDGSELPATPYWLRRRITGDVIDYETDQKKRSKKP